MGLGVLRRGHFTRPGTLPSYRGHPARAGTGILSPTASNAPGRTEPSPAAQDVPGGADNARAGCPRPRRHAPCRAGCPRRRGTSLWGGPPEIVDVPFDRGLRSPTEGDGPGAVIWGRSTSWAENAVLDGPGRPCGAVVETGQSRPRLRRFADVGVRLPTGRVYREVSPGWARPPVSGCSGIGFAPWLQDDASTPTPAPRPCASGPRSRARQTMNRPELGAEPAPTPPVPPTEPPDVG